MCLKECRVREIDVLYREPDRGRLADKTIPIGTSALTQKAVRSIANRQFDVRIVLDLVIQLSELFRVGAQLVDDRLAPRA